MSCTRISSLPSLESYSEDEIKNFTEYSPAAKIYFSLIKKQDIDPIYKYRHEAWLKVALANYYSKTDQETRSLFWSQSMDWIVHEVFNKFFTQEDSLLVLALGKYGSQVLNLSSDIDLILVTTQVTPQLIKKTRLFVRYLNTKTPDGFLTRVDLNLKPTDVPGPIVTAEHLSTYLWNSQELWERLAYTRTRKICGHIHEENNLFSEIEKFCFRKYIRMDLIFGLSELVQKILDNNQDIYNIKLCSGGIRSLELLLSALQLLYAGRVKEFTSSSSYEIFLALEKITLYNADQIKILRNNYDQLRSLEDLIQSSLDEQNHHVNNLSEIQPILDENQKIIKIFLSTLEKSRTSQKSKLLEDLNKLSKKHPHLNDFIYFLNKHSSYISLFETHPKPLENLLKSLIYSPHVTKLILLRPDLMDLFLIKKTNLDSQDSIEDFLIQLSDFKSISQITAIGEFLTEFDLEKFLIKNSKTADVCVNHILSKTFENNSVDILKLGKWSSNELGVSSDLDFVFIYDGSQDLSKKARKFISYLTHNTFHGALYNIDLRLRPSGNAGPILTSYKKLKSYIETSAPIWLKQAYLRNALLLKENRLVFQLPPVTQDDRSEITDIRSKRFTRVRTDFIALKDNWGGLVDLEFYIQCLFLKEQIYPSKNSLEDQISELASLNVMSEQNRDFLINSYKSLRFIEQISEILFQKTQITPEDFDQILRIENIQIHLKDLTSFNDLYLFIQKLQNFIDTNHPFSCL